MPEQDISKKKELFLRLVDKGRLHDAIKGLRKFCERNMAWELTDEVGRAESAYRYLLRYAVDGVADPQRQSIYGRIVNQLILIFERLERQVYSVSDARLYYNAVRSYSNLDFDSRYKSYRGLLSESDEFSAVLSGADGRRGVSELESAERDLFNVIWVSYPFSDDDKTSVLRFMSDDVIPFHVKQLIVSALTLGNIMYFDDNRFSVLAGVYSDNCDERLSVTALVGILLSLAVHRKRRMSESVVNRLGSLRELPQWKNDLKTVFIELIRTRDTERISRKFREELVPKMIKIRPEITNSINNPGKSLDLSEIDENPEWQDIFEKSGLADKIKELSDIQEEGGDVFMGTFAHLKSFPFFYEISNWFLPFHTGHSTVAALGEGRDVIGGLIAGSAFLCNNDKYSFVLALGSVQNSQRDLMLNQLKAQNINAAELQSASLDLSTDRRRNIANKYIQDLYRFFRLFRRKDDFTDPFDGGLNLTAVPLLADEFSEGDTLPLVAEFYFRHKYYEEAMEVFKLYEAHTFPQADLYQKMGYCMQRMGDIPEALRYYEQAELLNSRSSWTIKRIASCHRMLGNAAQSLDYYRRLDEMEPDTVSVQLYIAECLIYMSKCDEALKYLFKALYLDESSRKARRLMAWALMMTKDFGRAEEQYKQILAEEPDMTDYFNAGHLLLASGRRREAMGRYIAGISSGGGSVQTFADALNADSKDLERIGVPMAEIPLIIDAVKYAIADEANS